MTQPVETAPTSADSGAAGAEGDGAGGSDAQGSGKTFTQADVDRIAGNARIAERQKYADYDEVKADAAELKKIRDGEKTEAQQLRDELDAEREEHGKTRTELSATKRTQYGIDKGIPAALAKKLTGTTPEELDAEIEELKPHIGGKPNPEPEPSKKPPRGSFKSGASGQDTPTDPKSAAAAAIRTLMSG